MVNSFQIRNAEVLPDTDLAATDDELRSCRDLLRRDAGIDEQRAVAVDEDAAVGGEKRALCDPEVGRELGEC